GHGMAHPEAGSCAALHDRGPEVALVRGHHSGDVVAAEVTVAASYVSAKPLGVGRDESIQRLATPAPDRHREHHLGAVYGMDPQETAQHRRLDRSGVDGPE